MKDKKWLITAWLLAVLCVPCLGWAQRLTQDQYQKLKTDITITNQAEFATSVANSDWTTIANAYNLQAAAPTFWVWKSSLTAKSIYEDTDADGGVWDWTAHMAQTVAERGAWDTMFYAAPVNPSLPQTRGAFTKIYSGNTTQQNAQKAHLLSISRRTARRIEVLLRVTTAGDGSTATPGTLGFEGTISGQDVFTAVMATP